MFKGVSTGKHYTLMFNFTVFREVIQLVLIQVPSEGQLLFAKLPSVTSQTILILIFTL